MQYFGFDRPSFGIKTFGFGANFDPMTLFADGKQGVWYDPSDKSTLFQDVAGTVPVTKDGDPVAIMRDKSGNNNHATQTVSASRPVYKTDGSLHWLEFDGVDDYFYIKNQQVTAPNMLIAVAVDSHPVKSGEAILSMGEGASPSNGFVIFASYSQVIRDFVFRKDSYNFDAVINDIAPSKYVGIALKSQNDGMNKVFVADRTESSVASSSDLLSGVMRVGARSTGMSYTGKIYSLIAVFSNQDADNGDIERYMALKTGLPL